MKKKRKRRSREEIEREFLRTDPFARQLKERIDYWTAKVAELDRRASS